MNERDRISDSHEAAPFVAGLPAGPVLAVCAHPDDESFGLGGLIAGLVDHGTRVDVLCLTHGEASTLHATPGELAEVRADELTEAATALGVTHTRLLAYPDGGLSGIDRSELAQHVAAMADDHKSGTFLVFDLGGITGHPDHQAATSVALDVALDGDRAVLAWTIPDHVARQLDDELGAAFTGRPPADIDAVVTVDRRRQARAIAAHRSQATHNPVLVRRLELLGDGEAVRWLRSAGVDDPHGAQAGHPIATRTTRTDPPPVPR